MSIIIRSCPATSSSFAEHEILQDGILFIQKPFNQDDLLAILKDAFRHN